MPQADWFDATFARSSTAAVLLDASGRIERTNEVFRNLLGEGVEPAGRTLVEVLSPAGAQLEASRKRAVQEGRKLELEGVLLEPSSRERRRKVDVELYPQYDERAQPSGVLMIVHDRAESSSDLEESARLFYQAFLHSTNAMELTDRDGFIVDVNPAFERIYGYRKEELLGRRPNVVASGKTERATYQRMWKELLDPEIGAWSGELVNRDRNGVDHPVLLAITAIRGIDGAITHFLGVAVDQTERRAWERAAMHSDRLASLGQLAAGVAHEINTPLANVMLIAESIRRRNSDGWTERRIESLLLQAESAAKIVRGLLDFARRPEAKVGEVDLASLVASAVHFIEGKQSADVDVRLTLPTEPVIVRADPDQLTQVVTNLLNNAYDALSGRGEVRVSLRAEPEWASITVADDGPGIPPEVLTHIFEPFFTTKGEGKGTGLGLAICHGIVQSHGGTIEVDSEPGRGAAFTVRLPRSAASAARPSREARTRSGADANLI